MRKVWIITADDPFDAGCSIIGVYDDKDNAIEAIAELGRYEGYGKFEAVPSYELHEEEMIEPV